MICHYYGVVNYKKENKNIFSAKTIKYVTCG